jgi:hypothetical protein
LCAHLSDEKIGKGTHGGKIKKYRDLPGWHKRYDDCERCRVPRKIRDLGFTLIALVLLFGMLVSINPNLRERTKVIIEDPQLDSVRDTLVNSVMSGAFLAQGYADHHLYMVAFLIAACVFFVLMLKVIS